MSTQEIQELERKLELLKRQESEKNKLSEKEKQEIELKKLAEIWTEDKIRQIIRNWYFEVEYLDRDHYIIWATREFIFWEYSWEKAIYEVKYGKKYDEDSEDFEEYDLTQLEIDYIMNSAVRIINRQIQSI